MFFNIYQQIQSSCIVHLEAPIQQMGSSSNILQRTVDIASHSFFRVGQFFMNMKNQAADESNIKTVAIIGCFCLITLFVVTLLLKRETAFRQRR